MTCLGEGGAVTTDDEAFAEQVRQLKTFGYVTGDRGHGWCGWGSTTG